MRLSANGRRLIQGFEGLSLKAYPDAAGYSIGYGHFGAKPGDVITREQAEALFDQDVAKYELAVSTTTPNATQQQFDAMTSLTYNIGTGGFAGSTVAKRHNMGDFAGAADAFRMWNKSQGKVLPVLERRREQERAVYLNGYGTAFPTQPMTPVSPAAPQPIAWSAPSSSSSALAGVAGGAGLLVAAAAALAWFLLRGGR